MSTSVWEISTASETQETVVSGGRPVARIVTDFCELERLQDDWNALWRANPSREIFGCFEWVRAFWIAYGASRELCTPVVYRGDQVVGILPLAVHQGTLQFLGTPRSDYNDFLCDDDEPELLLRTAIEALYHAPVEWKRGVLENLPEHSLFVRQRDHVLRGVRPRPVLMFEASCPAIDFSVNRAAVLKSLIKSKSAKYRFNKLKRQGDVRFRHIENEQEIRQHLPSFFRQHALRRKFAGDDSYLSDSHGQDFCNALVAELDPKQELRFAVLELDGRPIAYHLGFETNGRFLYYTPSFDVDLAACSPGSLLLTKLFEYAGERGLDAFDLALGDEAYKSRFANTQRKNYTLHLYRDGIRGVSESKLERLKQCAKRLPRLYAGCRTGLDRFSAHVRRIRSAVSREGLSVTAWNATSRLLRSVLFSKRDQLLFSVDLHEDEPADNSLVVEVGSLTDLGQLSDSHPEFVTTEVLTNAMRRCSRGDRLFLARNGDVVIHVAWMSRRDVIPWEGSGEQQQIILDEPGLFIDGSWTPPQFCGQGVFHQVLRELCRHARDECRHVWIACDAADTTSRQAIESAGFRLKFERRHVQILGATFQDQTKSCQSAVKTLPARVTGTSR